MRQPRRRPWLRYRSWPHRRWLLRPRWFRSSRHCRNRTRARSLERREGQRGLGGGLRGSVRMLGRSRGRSFHETGGQLRPITYPSSVSQMNVKVNRGSFKDTASNPRAHSGIRWSVPWLGHEQAGVASRVQGSRARSQNCSARYFLSPTFSISDSCCSNQKMWSSSVSRSRSSSISRVPLSLIFLLSAIP